ncbi:MAG TPA: cupin domain-containing protein [Allosphingosinicella sp.]|jgi:quercetin dioxygenase-like cupin family protein
MKLFAATALPLSLLACAPERPQAEQAPPQPGSAQGKAGEMEISRGDTRPVNPGPADWFTGRATIAPLFDANGSSQVGAALVTFAPGARTAWHLHPLGQRLVVVSGTGWTQVEGGEVETFRAGDVVWCPPDVRHWHGATPTSAMSHIAIQESRNGSPVTWMERVTDEQYRQQGAAR